MKFNTIQELWDYCLFCPICSKHCRQTTISVGPDTVFTLSSSNKINNLLNLQCLYKNRSAVYPVEYNINCTNNIFEIKVKEKLPLKKESNPERIKRAYFFFFIEGICLNCHKSRTHSLDLELDILTKTISNIGLDRENFILKDENEYHICINEYHISFIYDRNIMLVTKYYLGELGSIKNHGCIELPLVKLDLNDTVKAINKIKTLILFS